VKRSPAIILAALAALMLTAPASALLSVIAGTDRESVEINENIYLTVTVSGDSASVPEPKLPNMQNFNVYSSGRSQSISIINGKITTAVTFTYILTPRFIGLQTIGPISVFNGKEKAVTQELKITVTKARQTAAQQPRGRPQQPSRPQRSAGAGSSSNRGEQLFLKAETDKKTA